MSARKHRQLASAAADLWKEHRELIAEANRQLDAGVDYNRSPEIDVMFKRLTVIEDEITGAVARDKAGLIAQLHYLDWFLEEHEWDQHCGDLVRKVIFGIAILGTDKGAGS